MAPTQPNQPPRFIDSPLATHLLKFVQSVLTAIVIGGGASAINKLDNIMASINAFNKDMALVQRDVGDLRARQDSLGIKTEKNKTDILGLTFRMDQFDKDLAARHGR